MAFYIGKDLGTSAIKVILLDEWQMEHRLRCFALMLDGQNRTLMTGSQWYVRINPETHNL